MATDYTPPQPAFYRCRCGQLVLKVGPRKFVSPALGYAHVCPARERSAK
jgi:hypothetical protein